MYTIIYERNVTILESVLLLLLDIRSIKAMRRCLNSSQTMAQQQHQRYQSLDNTYSDWQHETIAWNSKLVSQKFWALEI